MFLLLLASVSGSAQWIAGLAVSGFAWRRHRSAGLKLSLAALAGLTALEIIAGSVFTLLIPPIINEGFSAGTVGLMLNGVSSIIQLCRAALVILLAIAFFRLLQENHEADTQRNLN
jgi:hypothetical protein